MRENSFKKILKNKNIGLSSESVMNYILYEDILDLIKNDRTGTITLRAKEDITLGEVSKLVKSNTQFGDFVFNIESPKKADTTKRTSKENIIEFLDEKNER